MMKKKYSVIIEEIEEQPKPLTSKEELRREIDAILDGYTPPAREPGKQQSGNQKGAV